MYPNKSEQKGGGGTTPLLAQSLTTPHPLTTNQTKIPYPKPIKQANITKLR